LKILIVADGPVPHPYMNYRADPLAKYLADRAHDVSVLCAKPIISSDKWTKSYENINFIYIPEYTSIRKKTGLIRRTYQLISMIKKLSESFKKEKFDVVRPISFVPAWAVSTVIRKPNFPIITNLSDFYSDLYKQFELPASLSISRLLQKMERDIVTKSDVFIVDSPTQRKYWKNWMLEEKKCIVLPHGIPRSYNHNPSNSKTNNLRVRLKYGVKKSTKVVFYIGDISRLDGLDILIEAAPIITKQCEDVKFIIIGSGTEKYMQMLRQQIRKTKLEKCFIFIPRIPHYHVPSYIATADVCVAPFRITLTSNSSIPNKILEYIAMKKLVVATEGKGIKETLGDIIRYVEPENSYMLADTVSDVLNENLFADRLGKKIEMVISRLNWRNIVQREELIIKAALNQEVQDFRVFDYRLHE